MCLFEGLGYDIGVFSNYVNVLWCEGVSWMGKACTHSQEKKKKKRLDSEVTKNRNSISS